MTGSPDVCLVASRADHPGVCEHLTAGGAAAILEPAGLVMQAGGMQSQFYPVEDRPLDSEDSSDGRLAHAFATAAWVSLTRSLGTRGGELLTRLHSRA
jgi:hypothetical protein